MDFQQANNLFGGTTAGARNVVCANGTAGLRIISNGNSILGNFIGVGADGTTSLGNAANVDIQTGSNNIIGGVGAGEANIIANGTNAAGVAIRALSGFSGGRGNIVRGNSIFNNISPAPGIDIDADGVTPNDSKDSDTGTNDLQNFPIITNVNQALAPAESAVVTR